MHAIVENAVYGLDDEHSPAQILLANRSLLVSYAESRNRVTNIGRDMCKLHRLIQLQQGLMRMVNNVIESL